MYESAHDAIHIPFTWNEFYHNTQPETILNIHTRYIFQRFLGKISAIWRILKLRVNGIISVTGTRAKVYQIS